MRLAYGVQCIIVTGGGGLLADALKRMAPQGVELILLGHADFELTNRDLMSSRLAELRPEVVINTAAYNLVDRCEIERDLSWAVNASAPQALAELCAQKGIRLVHYSTDYVFDGAKQAPYVETDATNPLNHYGAGKLRGEQGVLTADARHLVLRTSWLFGEHPTQSKTYIHSVLRAVRAGKGLKAAYDQHSTPTYAPDLAAWTFHLVRAGAQGLFHAVNDEGVSRCDWTKIIVAEAYAAGLISELPSVEAVPSASFNPTMRRPAYTVMNNGKLAGVLGRALGSWRAGLKLYLEGVKDLAPSCRA